MIMLRPNTNLDIIDQENFDPNYHLKRYSGELDGTDNPWLQKLETELMERKHNFLALHLNISDKPRGIQWTLSSQLEDLDFADDLAFLSVKVDHLQEKTNRLGSFANETELTISTTK